MMTAPVDPRFALDSANESDLVQKKVSIDAMRKRVSGGPSEESKLRGACEGFESIFLQKMWEQMRKNVKKEGYLHSKDEEAYQSMFDVELAKKMASAGGIGLGEMLYEQLSQKLHNASKTTGLAQMREPLPIEPARPPKPAAAVPAAPRVEAPANLYSESEAEVEPVQDLEDQEKILADGLRELAATRDPSQDPANATYPMFDLQTGNPLNPVAGKIKENSRREIAVTAMPERISPPGRVKPSNAIGAARRPARRRRQAEAASDSFNAEQTNARMRQNGAGRIEAGNGPSPARAAEALKAAASAAAEDGFSPAGTTEEPDTTSSKTVETGLGAWPVRGEVLSFYGRQPDDSWNTGVAIAAAPGSSVAAPMDGVVSRVNTKDGLPQLILAHDGGLTTHFLNVASNLTEGDRVQLGMEIAKIPSSEESSFAATSPQMRFEVRRGELAINPKIILG